MRIYKRGTAPVTHVQLYGERNSATTYLARLLQDSMAKPEAFMGLAKSDTTPLGIDTFGYKHWFIDWEKLDKPLQHETLFVVIYRNPYTWVQAMMDRPYALERSLSGHGVVDLPKVKLAGHINGKDTQNEFDPETGEQLTLFELRRKKIARFEELKDHADNVVFLTLEELLADPGGIIKELAVTFETAFKRPLAPPRAPFRQLVQEFIAPHLFGHAEQAILDQSLDWATEAAAGYAKGDYAQNTGPTSHVFILHGGSCTGKTSLMHSLVKEGRRVHGIETDDCAYWEERDHNVTLTLLRRLVPSASARDVEHIHDALKPLSPKAWLCAEFLMNTLADLYAGAGSVPDIIVATGGALPEPSHPGTASLYSWLAERLPITFHHALIDVDEATHLANIESRGRAHLRDGILAFQAQKRANRDSYDFAASGFEALAHRIENRTDRPVFAPQGPSDSARPPHVRLRSGGLRYIQIFGERNSGTKHLKLLVSETARDPDAILGAYANKADPVNKAKKIGYKHYYPQLGKIAEHNTETLFLVIYKNPYTWIRSMMGKPYHFKKCLDGKSITDLPEIRLHGVDIHGRDIPDVHPQTGERLTLFELRKYKIQQWEALAYQVHNIAFVNYEDLLVAPSATIQQIIDGFPSLFTDSIAPERTPDPRYLAKYVSPDPFPDHEMAVMDAHIDWSMETLAGYEKGNLFLPNAP
ncbi:MAG: hypothetical protein AAGA71_12685 [Pseudomonadota bacterium]